MACAAASVDGLYVAIVREGELSLYTVEPFAEIARAQLASHEERTIAFVGRQILVFDTTRLTVFSMQRLALTAQLELDPPARLLATSHHYALLARNGLVIASCTNEGAALAPTRTPGVAERVVGLDNSRFLVWGKKGPGEIWDATTRLPTARVGLELPVDTTDVGATGKHRSIWIATAGGDLLVSRLSDGKTTVAPLPRPAQHIVSHPSSAWLVLDFDGEPHAVNSVLRTWQRLDIPAGRARTLAPSIGSHAYVIVDEGSDVVRYEIGVDAAPKRTTLPVGGPLPEGEETVPIAPPSPVVRVSERRIEVADPPRAEPAPPPSPAPVVGSSLASRFANREPGRRLGMSAAPIATTPKADWHDALFQWSKKVLGDAPKTELPPMQSPITELADRAQLDVSARRIINILYADWLAGHGDAGLPASKLVEIAGQSAWPEALGSGYLGKLGIVASHVGRCRLAAPVGAYFDGRAPQHAQRTDGAGQRGSIADGCYRSAAAPADLARVLGTIATEPQTGDNDLARLEAWIRGWPFVGSAPATDVRPGELVIVLGDHAGLPDLPGV
ncbi:MAG: hypothetical protein M4D80_28875 [Myxococcota bacterium]|nr:hypothetical protein [Myxococcota bacterium]